MFNQLNLNNLSSRIAPFLIYDQNLFQTNFFYFNLLNLSISGKSNQITNSDCLFAFCTDKATFFIKIQLKSCSIMKCQISDDCLYLNFCNNSGECEHDNISFNVLTIIIYILIPILVGVSNVGGIGGGIIKIPVLVLILNYTQKYATNLSYPITLGGVIGNVAIIFFQKHPHQNRPLIDYNLVMMMAPPILIGTAIGVNLNIVLADLYLSIFFVLFLFVVSPYLLIKAIQMKRQQNAQMKKEQNQISEINRKIEKIEKEIEDDQEVVDLVQNQRKTKKQKKRAKKMKMLNKLKKTRRDIEESTTKENAAPIPQNQSIQNPADASYQQNTQDIKIESKNFQNNKIGIQTRDIDFQSKNMDQNQPSCDQNDDDDDEIRSEDISDTDLDSGFTESESQFQDSSRPFNDEALVVKKQMSQTMSHSLSESRSQISFHEMGYQNDIKQNKQTNAILKAVQEKIRRKSVKMKQVKELQDQKLAIHQNNQAQLNDGLFALGIGMHEKVFVHNQQTQNEAGIQYDMNDFQQEDPNKQLQKILKTESRLIDPYKLFILLFIFAFIQFLQVLKGGKGLESIIGLTKCKDWYFLVWAMQYIFPLIMAFVVYFWLKKEEDYKAKIGFQFDKFDIRISPFKFGQVFIASLIAGLITGGLGVGAGLVIIPILLLLKVYPVVASAVSSIMYIFIAGSSIVKVLIEGSLHIYEILWFFFLSFVGGLVFGKLTYIFVNKYNCRYVVVLIVFVIAIINIICVFLYVYRVYDLQGKDPLLESGKIC